MVKRLLVSAVLAVFLALVVALPALADDGLTPPPTDPNRVTLSDQYSPETLNFYTPDGLKYITVRPVNSVLSALFSGAGYLVKWTGRALDYAWNFNLARWTSGLIDPMNVQLGAIFWRFGALLLAGVGWWITVRLFKNEITRLSAGLLALSIILGLAVWTRAGIGNLVADVEDAFSDVSGEILTAAARPGQQPQDTIASISDGLYQQLILDNWARANFSSLEAASKPEYTKDGIPGGIFLGASDKQAIQHFKDRQGDDNPDFSPWYSDSSIRTRLLITVNTWVSALLVLPVMLLLSVLVLGIKALTVIFAIGFPVAVFLAAMPWFSGVNFLKKYAVLVFLSPIVKTFCAVALAAYVALLDGLMSSATSIPGGWATVTLLLASLVLTTYLLWRPIVRALGSLLFQPAMKRPVATTTQTQVTRTAMTAAQAQAAMFQGAGGTGAAGGYYLPGPHGSTTPGYSAAMQARAMMHHTTTTVQSTTTQHGHQPAGTHGQLGKRHLAAHAAGVHLLQSPKEAGREVIQAATAPVHHGELSELLRETRRLVRTVANTAEAVGGLRK